ncbi:NAD(P)/FAD-dependent oxidoreductase [Candidatus Woesearchaeota archaeon]|nr:NAD(P)/FAD-dependent oxidoreductase [Candidatus Woesearchaeota archaeon]
MISIIGAGPAGCYSAYLSAKAGKEVNIFEEHKEVGKPVQCTGIVASYLEKIIKIKKEAVVNKTDRVRIFSPNKKCIELKLKKENIILDRKKFDQYLADMAERSGSKIFLNHKFLDYKKNILIIKDLKNNKIKKIKTGYLVGADGPLSRVAKSCGLFSKREFMTGLQVRVELKNENCIEFYPFIGNFAWIVPEGDDVVRLGVASYKNVKKDFDCFLKLKKINEKNIIEKQAGLIPVYNPKLRTQKNNVYLVGDAAAQVKATTGGGIIQGLLGAGCLVNAILTKKNYEGIWKGRLGRDLFLHLQMRKILDKLSNEDYNYLISLFDKKEVKEIIEKYDRDFPSNFLLRLALKEPRLLCLSMKLFK